MVHPTCVGAVAPTTGGGVAAGRPLLLPVCVGLPAGVSDAAAPGVRWYTLQLCQGWGWGLYHSATGLALETALRTVRPWAAMRTALRESMGGTASAVLNCNTCIPGGQCC